jgi:hypothetical protein
MDVKEIEWKGANWINLAEDRDHCRAVVDAVINIRVL